jgi:hypothetical protein
MFRKLMIVLGLLAAAIIGTAGLSRAQPQPPIGIGQPSYPQPRAPDIEHQLQQEFEADRRASTEEMRSITDDWLAEDSGWPAWIAPLAVAAAGIVVTGAIVGAIGGRRARSRRLR